MRAAGCRASPPLTIRCAQPADGRYGLAEVGSAAATAAWFRDVWRVHWEHATRPTANQAERQASIAATDPLAALLPPESLRLSDILQVRARRVPLPGVHML